ncbi:MAG: hypothetical protein K2M93_07225 [Muribaculaceae bacterium]|nr:hypothetical protein [Muribaculaceae bacterium]
MIRKLVFGVCASLCLLSSCQDVAITNSNDRADIILSTAETELIDNSYYPLSLRMMGALSSGHENENIIFSPMSLTMALSMVANSDNESQAAEILDMMNLGKEDLADLNNFNSKLINTLPELDRESKIALANSIWYNSAAGAVSDKLEEVLRKDYHASVTGLSDLSSTDAMNRINKWCSDATNGFIPTLLSAPSSAETAGIIANAFYYKGKWTEKFNRSLTADKDFHTESGAVAKVATMKNPALSADACITDNYSAIRLPYGNEAYSMVIILPAEGKSIKDCLTPSDALIFKKFSMGEKNPGDNATTRHSIFDFEMPLFSLKSESGLNSILGISSPYSITQVAKITVDEDGSEAATGSTIMTDSDLPKTDKFKVNRPFMFMIAEKSSGIPLFIGKVSNPQID